MVIGSQHPGGGSTVQLIAGSVEGPALAAQATARHGASGYGAERWPAVTATRWQAGTAAGQVTSFGLVRS
jgi:hypothetical protein